MENNEYYQKYLKYKKKYDNLRQDSDTMNGGSNKERVGCALLHEINGKDHILMIQGQDRLWKLPSDFVLKSKKSSPKEYVKTLSDIFKKITQLNIPEIDNTKIFHKGGNRIFIGKINHVDTNQFKPSEHAQSIGFISLDMLKKHNYFPSKSMSIDPQISDVLQSMDDSEII